MPTPLPHIPNQIHPQQGFRLGGRFPGIDRFVGYAHSMFIGSHFCPPKPGRSAYHNGMGLGDLVDGNVSTLEHEDRKKRAISCQVPLVFTLH